MIGIYSPSRNPYFNLSAEEFLFKNIQEDVLFLYVNDPAVVIGKHQNAWKEVNFQYITENNIPLIRRLSGGGTVYHDDGNLNFSIHKTVSDPAKISFGTLKKPILEFLQTIYPKVELNNRNDLIVGEKKISGNAEHVFRKKILSHGTLLIDSNLQNLSNSLKATPEKFNDKAVKSVRSKVDNLSSYLSQALKPEEVANDLLNYFIDKKIIAAKESLTSEQREKINALSAEKYQTWEWNYAYSPKFEFTNTMPINNGEIRVDIGIVKGTIDRISIQSGLLTNESIETLEKNLHSQAFHENTVIPAIEKVVFSSEKLKALVRCMFNL